MDNSIFQIFSTEHIAAMIILFTFNLIIITWLKKTADMRTNDVFRISLGVIIIILELLGNIWKIYYGEWSLSSSLPLHLCGITSYLCIIMLIRRTGSLYGPVFFWGLAGATIAVITPSLKYNFPHPLFLKFFIDHNVIILSALYITFIENYRPDFKSVLRIFLITNVYMAGVGAVNYALDANYLYICRKPRGTTFLNHLGPWPYYILSMEAVTFLIFFILYLIFNFSKFRSVKLRIHNGR